MNARVFNRFVVALVLLVILGLTPAWLFAADAPTYRGKVVMIVDKTIASDPDVSPRIERLINDLTGDGWRVLRHDVERGPEFPPQPSDTDATNWALANAPRIREIRALIEADYNAATNEVKNVFLIGHVPVPYSGTAGFNGGHFQGAQPADTFYGEMTGWYGAGGWSDTATELGVLTEAPWLPEDLNLPDDGRFDQNFLPAPMKLGVGRVDLCRMPDMELNEATMIARYLDKDHDFRCGNFSVPRRAIVAGENTGSLFPSDFTDTFGAGNITQNYGQDSWFPEVSAPGSNYLMGYGFGHSGGNGNPFIGTTAESPADDFSSDDSRVVFVNLYGSWFGDWESGTFLKAPLCNPYDPVNGRYGFGLTCVYVALGLDDTTLSNRSLGATIGEALFVGRTQDFGQPVSVNYGLMGDPTLRLHSVQQPGSLTLVNGGSTITASWTASADPAVTGYNIYSAPTRRGPFILLNTGGPVSGTTYTATRPPAGSTPDNFYMVRAVKPESTPVGSYVNMADGIITNVPGILTPYLNIVTQPVSQTVAAQTKDGIVNSAVFTVDAVGSDRAGSAQILFQWYNANGPLTNDCHFHGVTTSSLLISGLQASDAGSYHVVMSNLKTFDYTTQQPFEAINTVTSSTATLTINNPPTAANDAFTIIRNTPSDFNVLANDTDPDTANSALTVISVSAPSDPTAGTLTINSDQRTIHFVPATCWLGQFTFTYLVFDGTTADQGTVTVTVNPTPGDTAPAVSSIYDQQMNEDTTIDVSFTVSDNLTTPDNLTYSATCSNPALIPNRNFTFSGTGANRVLQIQPGTYQVGTGTVSVTVTDCDAQSTTITFHVTVNPMGSPTMLPQGFSSNGFQVSINGPADSLVEILQSDDLINWISLGKVLLNGNLYSFVDASASPTTPQRFYTARADNGCSLNTVGFINITVPANTTVAAANQLTNPLGNAIQVLFAGVPTGTEIQPWDPIAQGFNGYSYLNSKGTKKWSPDGTATLNPGQGFLIQNSSSSPFTVTFLGDVAQGEQINNGIAAIAGNFSLLGSIIPASGTLDSLGFPAAAGDIISEVNSAGTAVPTATNTSSGWNPAAPTVSFGQSFWIQSGSSTTRSWVENFSPCSVQPTGVQPVLSDAQISSNAFSFSISSLAGSYWDVYQSSDLTNWTLIAGVTLNGSGTGFFTNSTIAGVPCRFYRLSDGTTCSQPIGFTRIQVGAGTTNNLGTNALIANQLNAPNGNTLDGLFNVNGGGTMPDGTPLPDGSEIYKWNGSSYSDYTWTRATGWLDTNGNPAGTVTLNPGEGAFLSPTNAITVTFVGLVGQGTLSNPIQNNSSPGFIYSSVLPQAGRLVTDLRYPLNLGDIVLVWTNAGFSSFSYLNSKGTPKWIPGEPSVTVGQSFFIQTDTNKTWIQNLSPCSGQTVCSAPSLTETQISGSAFSLNAAGPEGTAWSVYDSTDLTNWTLIEGLTLNSSGVGSYTDNSITGVPYRFYRFSDQTCCSQPIGFTRIPVGADLGTNSLIANQLYAPTNTLDGLFNIHGAMPDGTPLPDGSIVSKWNGSAYLSYTWSNASGWLDTNGNGAGAISLNPGEGAFLTVSNALTVTFVGLVGQGTLSNPIQSNGPPGYIYSSVLPQAGRLSSDLGYPLNLGDTIELWTNGTFSSYSYLNSKGTPKWIPGEPSINLGEAFFIQSSTNSDSIQNFLPCQ